MAASMKTGLGLLAALGVAVSGWGYEHIQHGDAMWSDLLDPVHIFSLIGVIAGVLVAWLTPRPGRASGGT